MNTYCEICLPELCTHLPADVQGGVCDVCGDDGHVYCYPNQNEATMGLFMAVAEVGRGIR